jgi:3-oxoacyl-[acyl-carrier-protein] synthase-1
LILGVPEEQRAADLRQWFDQDLYALLQDRVLRHFHASSALLPYGNAAGVAGLQKARDLIDRGDVDACIVGGVDSFVNEVDLARLERTWRLHREGESNGQVPGEAAAFVAVGDARRWADAGGAGIVAGVGISVEESSTTVLSEGHPTGQGLRRALEDAVREAEIDESAVGLRLTDLNGERFGAMDSMLALSRFYRAERDGLPIWHPAECVGETGAAVGALLLQIACHAFARNYAPSATVMCETASDGGHRSACVVKMVGTP